jgi:hypothetical protein
VQILGPSSGSEIPPDVSGSFCILAVLGARELDSGLVSPHFWAP